MADRIIGSLTLKEPGWVGAAAVLELVWVMSSQNRIGRTGIAAILGQLLFEAADRLPGLLCHIHIFGVAVGAALFAELGLEHIKQRSLPPVRIAGLPQGEATGDLSADEANPLLGHKADSGHTAVFVLVGVGEADDAIEAHAARPPFRMRIRDGEFLRLPNASASTRVPGGGGSALRRARCTREPFCAQSSPRRARTRCFWRAGGRERHPHKHPSRPCAS